MPETQRSLYTSGLTEQAGRYQPNTLSEGINKLMQYENMIERMCYYYDMERVTIWLMITVSRYWLVEYKPLTILQVAGMMKGRVDKGFYGRLRPRVHRLVRLDLLEEVAGVFDKRNKHNIKYYAPTDKALRELKGLLNVIG
jgi:hypothetical protein